MRIPCVIRGGVRTSSHVKGLAGDLFMASRVAELLYMRWWVPSW